MAYASPTWEFAAGTYLMKLQRLQNRVLCAIGNLDIEQIYDHGSQWGLMPGVSMPADCRQ
jgi:hypothetical protein